MDVAIPGGVLVTGFTFLKSFAGSINGICSNGTGFLMAPNCGAAGNLEGDHKGSKDFSAAFVAGGLGSVLNTGPPDATIVWPLDLLIASNSDGLNMLSLTFCPL